MSATQATDKGIGLALLFGILAVAGAAVSLLAPGTLVAAGGFAVAVTLGVVLVGAIHLYW